jgi:hypothetical protein
MSKVVSIKGEPVLLEGQADPDVVEYLERRLEDAKQGKIVGIASAWVLANGSVSNSWAFTGSNFSLAAAISILHHEYMAMMSAATTDSPEAR